MNYLDSHCHLIDEAFKDDLDDILDRTSKLERCLLICMNQEEFEKALVIKEKYPFIDLALGIHPEDEKTYKDKFSLKELEDYLIKYPFIKAIGEIGLDYYWVKDNVEGQKELFINQIKLAIKYHKPICIHCRDAIQDTYDILSKYNVDALLHCYSGSKEMAKEFVKIGCYISFGGVLTFKNAKEIKEVAKVVPLDRILIETDCPYLTPEPKRGQRNEPSYVSYTGEYLSKLLDIDEEELKKTLVNNYDRFFELNNSRYNKID